MRNGEGFLRQLSSGGGGGDDEQTGWGYSTYCYSSSSSSIASGGKGSKRWGKGKGGGCQAGADGGWDYNNANAAKKRVMVVVDHSAGAKHAMMWALTHIANKGDLLTLLHVIPPPTHHHHTPNLATSLATLCKACKPEVEVEALVIQGTKLDTVLSQVRKLEASVLVLSQSKPSLLCCLFRSKSEEFVEQCINRADCLTLAVRRQSKGVGGYLVSTRWQKNFWLLA